jgi:drug/metabolite transporter (DMT)-like permease
MILLGAIWGASFLFMRIAAPAMGPAALIALRLFTAALFLGVMAVASGKMLPLREKWRHFLFIGAVNSAAPFLLFAYAALTLPASVLALFNSLAAIAGAIVAAIWLKTPVTRRAAAGLALGVAGVGVLTAERMGDATLDGTLMRVALSFLAALAAPICYGVATTYIKRHALGASAFDNAHGSLWFAAVLTAPLAFAFAPAAAPAPPQWAASLALGILCTGVAYLMHFRLISEIGPMRTLTVAYLIPLFGVIWGAVFLGEPITPALLGAGALILSGLYLAVQPPAQAAARAA